MCPERFCPSEHFELVALPDEGHLVVVESEETFGADVLSCEDVSADETDVVCGIVVELGDVGNRHARNRVHVARIDGLRTGDGHLAAEIQFTCVQKLTDCCEHHQGDGPDCFALSDRVNVVNLDSDISGRMLS